jgi:hypothetical protein
MYEYLLDNQCTDGALARGVEQILNSFAKDKKVASVGLAFVLASAASSFFIYVCTSKALRGCLSRCCGCFSSLEKTPSYENKAYELRQSLGRGITRTFTRKKAEAEGEFKNQEQQ